MEAVVIVGAVIGLFLYLGHLSSKKRTQQEAELQRLYEEQQDHSIWVQVGIIESSWEKLEKANTLSPKINACHRIQKALEEIETYPRARTAVPNLDEIAERVDCLILALPVVDKVEAANRHKFKGNTKPEINALADALYHIHTSNVTDEHLLKARAYPEGTGEILTMQGIEDRCRALGWKGPHEGKR